MRKRVRGSSINFDTTMTKSVLIIIYRWNHRNGQRSGDRALCPFDFERIAKAVPEIRGIRFFYQQLYFTGDHRFVRFETGALGRLCAKSFWTNTIQYPIRHSARTDTMAYSAAALSFMLEQSNKTGCFSQVLQIPMGNHTVPLFCSI